ncbi:MAG: GlsB/YeaQ/YmgE family stress response membrane protein [Candidatus Krumholzibacteriota bacterium]|nr:GlsB/YeaQ/YmgE family stress response membrane protein [Candidatus Krumholzibacteriota bacterium]
MAFLWFLIIGAVIGWLAGRIVKGSGFGLIGNILVGILGALLGGWLFRSLTITLSGLAGSLVTALVGAIILVLLLNLIRRK